MITNSNQACLAKMATLGFEGESDTPVFKAEGCDLGRCSKYSNYFPLPHFLIGIVNFPYGNFDNFDLRLSESLWMLPHVGKIICQAGSSILRFHSLPP
jgi:hypothetical protein